MEAMTKRFSICHTTARTEGWKDSYFAWCMSAVNWSEVEYILCMDVRWGFTPAHAEEARGLGIRVVWNVGRKCMVDGYSYAAAASTGAILIMNSDDIFPPHAWDDALSVAARSLSDPYVPFVIQTASGTAADARGLMVLQILSRARFERLGYALYPGYESMYADDDFSEMARRDGVVIDATHLLFEHRHAEKTEWDAVYKHQNREQAYAAGAWMLDLRRACGFGIVSANMPRQLRRVAFCLPGESFSWRWISHVIQLQWLAVQAGFEVHFFWGHSSSVFVTRAMLRQQVLEVGGFHFVLMLDDDNLLTFPQFQQMVCELEAHPELSGVSAWTWIQPDDENAVPIPSCGMLSPEGKTVPFTPKQLREATGLLEVEYSGFPCLLLRFETLEAAGNDCFLPIFRSAFEWGMSSEDYAFFVRSREKGMRFVVDPRLCVPHLKTRAIAAPRLDQEPIDLTTCPVAGPLQKEELQHA